MCSQSNVQYSMMFIEETFNVIIERIILICEHRSNGRNIGGKVLWNLDTKEGIYEHQMIWLTWSWQHTINADTPTHLAQPIFVLDRSWSNPQRDELIDQPLPHCGMF